MRSVILIGFLISGLSAANAQEVDSLSMDSVASVFEVDSMIHLAESLIGVPYKYGGCSPEGFDCSGFVGYVYSKFGVELPRSTAELANIGSEIPLDSCQKGDIILFAGRDKKKRPVGHAGIVVSESGEPLQFIHSATSNARGIIVTALDSYDYYLSRFVKVVRITD
ncbi:MAG: glycoside hydrolase [Flavobacteriales bacterium]|nr:glycoside hydrolase [Flavobacteriales bacterium]